MLTPEQSAVIDIVSTTICSIAAASLLAAISVMLCLGHYKKTHHHLVLVLFCTFLPDAFLEGISRSRWLGNQDFCHISGFFVQFFSASTVLWLTLIATNLYRMIILLDRNTYRLLKIYHWFVWSTASFWSFLPLSTNSYAPSGGSFFHSSTSYIILGFHRSFLTIILTRYCWFLLLGSPPHFRFDDRSLVLDFC